jgi:MOSC domain-containing protein YiiM
MNATLESIQVGLPATHGTPDADDPMDRPWTSGFFKHIVSGPVEVTWSGVTGDGQADLVNHGGPDKAVLAYSADHYPDWRSKLARPDLPFGAFGENLTIHGLTETSVCLGDIWRIGPCRFEVSQPRPPCWKLARRWRLKELPALVVANGRTGWYFRILQAGIIQAGLAVELEARPHPDWPVGRANRIMYQDKLDVSATQELIAVPTLSTSWKETLQQRVG